MKRFKQSSAGAAIAALALTGAAHAQVNTANEVRFEADGPFDSVPGDDLVQIDTSTTLSADKWYNIVDRTIVLGGASLTIPAGTVFASENPNNQPGTLVIARGAQIFAEGTAENPIIFTSLIDLQNWENDPTHPPARTRATAANGGRASSSGAAWPSSATPASATRDRMIPMAPRSTCPRKPAIEGLPNLANNVNFYGGLDDEDDSGVFKFVSLSYGGDDFEPATDSELNGISVGGTGRGTDFQPRRGVQQRRRRPRDLRRNDERQEPPGLEHRRRLARRRPGLARQGAVRSDHSRRFDDQAPQGSGFGDNGIEFDGADGDTSAQPITAGAIWNATVIGAPSVDGVDQ